MVSLSPSKKPHYLRMDLGPDSPLIVSILLTNLLFEVQIIIIVLMLPKPTVYTYHPIANKGYFAAMVRFF